MVPKIEIFFEFFKPFKILTIQLINDYDGKMCSLNKRRDVRFAAMIIDLKGSL